MRNPRFNLAATLAGCVLAVAACVPGGPPTNPTATLEAGTPPVATAAPSVQSHSSEPAGALVPTKMVSWPLIVGVPANWHLVTTMELLELDQRLRAIDPAVADLFPPISFEDLGAVDMGKLPGTLSAVTTVHSCGATTDVADRLAMLRALPGADPADAIVVEVPSGDVATTSFVREVGPYMLRTTVYLSSAPTTDCDGTLEVYVIESDPEPGLAEAIARSVVLSSLRGAATLELSGAIVLAPTDFPMICAIGGESDTDLRMSSGESVGGALLDLAIDTTGQPIGFQLTNGELLYASGKGFDARTFFVPEARATRARGGATFAGITPPDDAGHALSGRVTWDCPLQSGWVGAPFTDPA